MEDEFWAHNGEPKIIEPYIVESVKGGKRKSWIYIMYEKDQLIKKKDEFDWWVVDNIKFHSQSESLKG